MMDGAQVAAEVERRLDAEQHERLCACRSWPESCATYGTAPWPWTHTDVAEIVALALQINHEENA